MKLRAQISSHGIRLVMAHFHFLALGFLSANEARGKGEHCPSYLHLAPGHLTMGYIQQWEVSQASLTPTSTPCFFNFLGRTSFFYFRKENNQHNFVTSLKQNPNGKAHESSKVFAYVVAAS